MSEEKKEVKPSKGAVSHGTRTRARKAREMRKCRKAIRHLEERKRYERAARARAHLVCVNDGKPTPSNGRSERRFKQQAIENRKSAKAVAPTAAAQELAST